MYFFKDTELDSFLRLDLKNQYSSKCNVNVYIYIYIKI